jgi:[ribosomal protein S18]-alanine N-acetyltransferase
MIRAARTADLDQLADLESRSFDSDRLSRDDLRRQLRSTRALLLVDADQDRLHGYVLLKLQPRRRRAHMLSIATHPEQRRRGVGRSLLAAAEQAARDVGIGELQLETREDNLAAQALYRSLGYQAFGRYLGYYEDRADACRMRKALTADTALG